MTVDALLAAPPALPPTEALLGDRIIIGILWGVAVIAVCRLIYLSRRSLLAAPSVHAVTGTRWCMTSNDQASVRRRAALFAYRFSLALWQIIVLVSITVGKILSADAAVHASWGFVFMFFTVWNYIMQTVFWISAASASAASLCGASGPSHGLRRLTSILLSISVPMSILVSAVLWGVLFPATLRAGNPDECLNLFSYSMHALNTLTLLIEAAVDRMLAHRGTLGLVLLWMLLYAAFAWVQNAATHFWPYFFMRLDTYAAIGWYVGLLLLHGVAFGLLLLLSNIKARCDPTLVEADAQTPAGRVAPADGQMGAVLLS